MTDLTNLIARVETATEGSRELDQDIFHALGLCTATAGACDDYRAPLYTTSLDAKLPGEDIELAARTDDNLWHASDSRNRTLSGIAWAATEPLARRAAALRAIQHEREHR